MSIKSILVPYAGANAAASLRAALAIAKEKKAHVEILHARPGQENLMPVFLPQPAFAGELFAELSSENNRHLETALSFCSEATERAGIEMIDDDEVADAPSASLHIANGTLEALLPLRARVADLVVMNLAIEGSPAHYDAVIRAALFRSGAPVLLVPEKTGITLPVAKAVVAWNGSFESARALKLAIPMLAGAKCRVFTGVEGGSPAIPPAEAARFLCRHGVDTEDREEFLELPAGEALLKAAADYGANLLVMGAFSREDRWRETLMGSLTTGILKEVEIPVLMAN